MKQGDFTRLAKQYCNRTGYSELVLKALIKYIDYKENFKIADVGAGTGKLTKQLLELGLNVSAIEPNDAMREEGIEYTSKFHIEWKKGSGEDTTLETESVNWLLMASSFHWTDPNYSLPEFSRVLKPSGFLTVLWNPRNIEKSDLHLKIEKRIHEIVPDIKRVSSGSSKYTADIEKILISTGHFKDVIFMEAEHEVIMSKERYLGAWESVNDIQAQAGEERWKKILDAIKEEIDQFDQIVVPYKTRAWTAQKV